ncbi:MAG: NAD-dependent epimerase/dehydratase family protein [Ferruginibacter sp.]
MILVTGGSGLVGREVILQLLAQGKDVAAIYHTTPLLDFPFPGVRAIQCDLSDVVALEEAMHGITQIFHCAAKVSFNPKYKQQLYKINVEGTANIVNAALNAGVYKMLHVSSVAALGRLRENEAINEKMEWSEETSNSIYGHTKYLGELEVWRGVGEGLEAVIVNPTVVLGPGNWNGGSSEIFKKMYEEFPWYSEGVSGFVDVRDVARAMIQLMDSNISDEKFILSACNKSFEEIFTMIAKSFGKKPPYKKLTPFLAGLIWRIDGFKSKLNGGDPIITRETVSTALAKVNFDNSKLKKFLPGFEYRPIEETIMETCAMLKKINQLA